MKKTILTYFLITFLGIFYSISQESEFMENPKGQSGEKSLTLINAWEQFYQAIFGIEVDFSQMEIPEIKEHSDLVIVAKEITLAEVITKCKEVFHCKGLGRKLSSKIVNDRGYMKDHYAILLENPIYIIESMEPFISRLKDRKSFIGVNLSEQLLSILFSWWYEGEYRSKEPEIFYYDFFCVGSRHVENNSIPQVTMISNGSMIIHFIPLEYIKGQINHGDVKTVKLL